MTKCEPEKIHIPTFYTPGLFWFIFDKDINEKNAFNAKLQKKMVHYNVCDNPKVGQFVAIRQNTVWVRAEVRLIQDNTQNNQRSIIVTLLDEGICRRVHTVYELPRDMQSVQPFANKGMIYGIISTKTNFDLVDKKQKNEPMEFWSVGAMAKFRNMIKQQFVILKFSKKLFVKEMGNLLAGDLFITPPDEKEFNLAELLVKEGSAIYNEDDFRLNLLQNGTDSDVELIIRELGEPKAREIEIKTSDVPLMRTQGNDDFDTRRKRSQSMTRDASDNQTDNRHQSRQNQRRNRENGDNDKNHRGKSLGRDINDSQDFEIDDRRRKCDNQNRRSNNRNGDDNQRRNNDYGRRSDENNRRSDEYNRRSDDQNKSDDYNRRSDDYNRKSDDYNRKSDDFNRRSDESNRRSDDRRRSDESNRRSDEPNRRGDERRRSDEATRRSEEPNQRSDERRRSDEPLRRSDKQNRRSNESNRRSDESNRRSDELNRRSDESNRRSDESSRRSDESGRRSDEGNRRLNDRRRSDEQNRRLDDQNRRSDEYNQRSGGNDRRSDDYECRTDRRSGGNDRRSNDNRRSNEKMTVSDDRRQEYNEDRSQNNDRCRQNDDRGRQSNRGRQNDDRGRQNDDRGRQNDDRSRQNDDKGRQNDKRNHNARSRTRGQDRRNDSDIDSPVRERRSRIDSDNQSERQHRELSKNIDLLCQQRNKQQDDNKNRRFGNLSKLKNQKGNFDLRDKLNERRSEEQHRRSNSRKRDDNRNEPSRHRSLVRNSKSPYRTTKTGFCSPEQVELTNLTKQFYTMYKDKDCEPENNPRLKTSSGRGRGFSRNTSSKESDSIVHDTTSVSPGNPQDFEDANNEDSESTRTRRMGLLKKLVGLKRLPNEEDFQNLFKKFSSSSTPEHKSSISSKVSDSKEGRKVLFSPEGAPALIRGRDNKRSKSVCREKFDREHQRDRSLPRCFNKVNRNDSDYQDNGNRRGFKQFRGFLPISHLSDTQPEGEVDTPIKKPITKKPINTPNKSDQLFNITRELNRSGEVLTYFTKINDESGSDNTKSDEDSSKNTGKSTKPDDELSITASDKTNEKSGEITDDSVKTNQRKRSESVHSNESVRSNGSVGSHESLDDSNGSTKRLIELRDICDELIKDADDVEISKKSVGCSDEASQSDESKLKICNSKKSGEISSATSLYNSIKNSLKGLIMSDRVSDNDSVISKSGEQPTGGIQVTRSNEIMARAAGKCSCEVCIKWTDSNEGFFNDIVIPKYEKKINEKPPEPPSLLLKTNFDESAELSINRRRVNYNSQFDQFMSPKVLIHQEGNVNPLLSLTEAPLHGLIKRALRDFNIEHINRMQAYTWPAVVHCDNTFIINGPKTGKKLSYLPALLSNVLTKKNPNLADIRMGPYIIILVPRVQIGEDVFTYINKLYMHARVKPKVILTLPPLLTRMQNDVNNGVEILITTPRILLELIKSEDTTLKRLVHIVLQGGDILLDNYATEVELVFELVQKMLRKRTFAVTIQMILISHMWTPAIETLAKRLTGFPNLVIGSYIEAALYGRTDIQVHLYNSQVKVSRVEDIIKDTYRTMKTVVICSNQNEVEDIYQVLSKYKIIKTEETSTLEEQNAIKKIWELKNFGEYEILLGTDDLFNTSVPLNITDASIVIQYSLPDTVMNFTKRFMFFLDNQIGPFVQYPNERLPRCKMHLFVDENSSDQFYRIINLILRLGTKLSDDVRKTYTSILKHRENIKVENNVHLCLNLKILGECHELDSCKQRHVISPKIDINPNLPQSGIIKLRILSTHNVTHYSARLIEHIDADGNKRMINNHYGEIAMKLSMKLTNSANRKPVYDLEIGTVCAVEESINLFRRCKVTGIIKYGMMNKPETVEVKLLDVGSSMNVSIGSLYAIDDELAKLPPQAVDIILENLGPLDGDIHWSSYCKSKLDQLLNDSDYEEPNCYFSGRIKLQLGNCLWVNNLILREYAPDGSLEVFKFSAAKTLLEHKLVEVRPRHMEKLYEYCMIANIELPDYSLPIIKRVVSHPKQTHPTWAHLENYQDYNEIYFCSADSPQQFFIRICKHQTLFDNMVDRIQEVIKGPHYPTDFPVIEGWCYLAKDLYGEKYSRVLIKKLVDNTAECFFVDYGEYTTINKSELKYLSDELITVLPFQVIECELFGIKPIDEKWTDESIEFLNYLAVESNTDTLRPLYVKVMDKLSGNVTDGSKYSVILVDASEDNQMVVNKEYVNRNLAVLTDDDPEFNVDFENFKPNVEPNDNNSEDDFEFTIEDINQMTKINADPDVESVAGSEKVFDIQINDFIGFFKGGIKKVDAYVSRDTPKEPEVLPSTSQGYSTPTVEWSETETTVELKIKLTGVLDYKLDLTENTLSFQTSLNGINYKLDLTLHSKAKLVKEEPKAFYFYILLNKVDEGMWERLISGKQRLSYIKYDPEKIKNIKVVPEKVEIQYLFDKQPDFIYEYGSDYEYDGSDIESLDDDILNTYPLNTI